MENDEDLVVAIENAKNESLEFIHLYLDHDETDDEIIKKNSRIFSHEEPAKITSLFQEVKLNNDSSEVKFSNSTSDVNEQKFKISPFQNFSGKEEQIVEMPLTILKSADSEIIYELQGDDKSIESTPKNLALYDSEQTNYESTTMSNAFNFNPIKSDFSTNKSEKEIQNQKYIDKLTINEDLMDMLNCGERPCRSCYFFEDSKQKSNCRNCNGKSKESLCPEMILLLKYFNHKSNELEKKLFQESENL